MAAVFFEQASNRYYEESCPDTGATYLAPNFAVPDIFYESALVPDGNGGLVPWVGTSFEHPLVVIHSQRGRDGTCVEIGPRNSNYYPAAQLTDEFGFLGRLDELTQVKLLGFT